MAAVLPWPAGACGVSAEGRALVVAGSESPSFQTSGTVAGVTVTEHAILEALLELERAAGAARGPEAGAPPRTPILPILERIDRLALELPATAPGDLRHYLQRKSYEKARLFLLDRDAENARGQCGH